MKAWIRKFLFFMQTRRLAANNTILNYGGDLNQFLEFCANHPRKPTLKTINSEIIIDYCGWLKKKKMTDRTINRRLTCLRSFFGFLKTKGAIKINPTEEITISKESPWQIYRVLTNREVERLLETIAKRSTLIGIRDLAMIELLLATGIQSTELVALDVEMVDLNSTQFYIRIIHKDRERTVPLPPRTAGALQRYLKETRPILVKPSPREKALFLARWGGRLTRQGTWLIVQGYARSAELGVKVTPGTLKHSFIAQQLARGTSLQKLQELLGHAQPHTPRSRKRLQARS